MDFGTFLMSFNTICSLNKISDNEIEIETKALFPNGSYIKLYAQKERDGWYFSDKKSVLRYMNDIYELTSKDVKSCISSVIKIYGITITTGALKIEIKNEKQIESKFFDFLMCIGQLVNMYAFFDKPE